MKPAELNSFAEQLLDLQEQILGMAELISRSASPVELDQNRVGRLSRMDAMQNQAMAQASVGRQSQQLTSITDALHRIDDGEYGRCLHCDDSIAIARLKIDPTAAYCISCAQHREKST